MNKLFLLVTLAGLIFITACSSGSSTEWNAVMEQTPTYIAGQSSFLAIQITDSEGKPVTGLDVTASLEMEKMDHGTIETDLTDGGEGIYQGNVELAMGGDWQAMITMTDGEKTSEKLITFKVDDISAQVSENTIALINEEEIVQEDIDFYSLINKLQIEMYREHDRNKYEGKELEQAMKYWDAQEAAAQQTNTLLTQIIRLRAVALLAEEKGYQVSDAEVTSEIEHVKEIYANSPAATKLIQEYGEDKFWNQQQKQYELIVLSQKVQQDVMDLVKEANPDAKSQELNMLAQKKYEELLVSQVSTLNITVLKGT